MSGRLTVHGVQGHVAYPQLADNPITRLVTLLAQLDALKLDDGTEWFHPARCVDGRFTDFLRAYDRGPARTHGGHNFGLVEARDDRWT